ncbi:MAG: thioredoxin family protein [Acidobacteria bacterium]|nr:thioredoxin family protein [Acidobacteriota bacterium]
MKLYVEKSLTYAEYLKLIDDLLAQEKTTGENQSEEMFHYGKLNRQRMKRLEKTVELNESLKEKARGVSREMIWLTITEGWCGDAAQNIPIIEKIAAENSNIETRYVLRDENLELMDKYLTNGGRAIPKLICLDAESLEEIGVWGSRPNIADDYFREMKAQGMEKPVMMEKMQRWYLQNGEQAIQNEFENLLSKWQGELTVKN